MVIGLVRAFCGTEMGIVVGQVLSDKINISTKADGGSGVGRLC